MSKTFSNCGIDKLLLEFSQRLSTYLNHPKCLKKRQLHPATIFPSFSLTFFCLPSNSVSIFENRCSTSWSFSSASVAFLIDSAAWRNGEMLHVHKNKNHPCLYAPIYMMLPPSSRSDRGNFHFEWGKNAYLEPWLGPSVSVGPSQAFPNNGCRPSCKTYNLLSFHPNFLHPPLFFGRQFGNLQKKVNITG